MFLNIVQIICWFWLKSEYYIKILRLGLASFRITLDVWKHLTHILPQGCTDPILSISTRVVSVTKPVFFFFYKPRIVEEFFCLVWDYWSYIQIAWTVTSIRPTSDSITLYRTLVTDDFTGKRTQDRTLLMRRTFRARNFLTVLTFLDKSVPFEGLR